MAIHYLNSIDLNQNELVHAVIENQPNDALAGTGVDGQLYYDTAAETLKIWKSGGWKEVDDFALSMSFNTGNGVLTTSIQNEPNVTVDLDGRYALIGDIPTVNNPTITLAAGTYLSGGGNFSLNQSGAETITFNHDSTTRSDTTSSDAPGYGGTFEAVTGVTTNTHGHVTAIDVSTVTIPASDNTDVNVTVANLRTRLGQISDDTTIGDAADVAITFSGGVVVTGDLTVSGTTTTVNTETINLADNIITLNSNETGTPSQDGGIEVERGTSTNVSLIWDESTDRWTFTNDGAVFYNIPIPSEYDNFTFQVGALGSFQEVSNGGLVSFNQGGGLTVGISGDDSITYSHGDTSSQNSVTNSSLNVIQNVSLDTYGHVTSLGSLDITSGVNTLIDTKINATGYATTITDTATITHSLNTRDVVIQLYDATTYETVYADVDRISTTQATITFASTPTNSVRVLVQKIS